jgi:hypothetical protein
VVSQIPRTGEQAHEPAPKLHDAPHVPLLGPEASPLAQVDVASHQPQPLVSVQLPQLVAPAQGSGAGHEALSQLQSEHANASGPDALPASQVPVSPHQPQSASAVQSPQELCEPQLLPVHSEVYQLQAPHVPVLGPVELPVEHVPVSPHQPQVGRPVQSPQSTASAQGSVPPVHSLGSQLQSPHEPLLGPVEVPTPQRPVSPHHPQG